MAKTTATKKRARPQTLKGMEDSRIEQLDQLARDYAEYRDQRIALNKAEADLKEQLRTAMHKHKKTSYSCDGVTIRLVSGDEEVKVKIKADKVEIDEE